MKMNHNLRKMILQLDQIKHETFKFTDGETNKIDFTEYILEAISELQQQIFEEGEVHDSVPERSCLRGKRHELKLSSHSDGESFYVNKYTCEHCKTVKTKRFER
jgi:hypothetical protein